MSSAHNNIRWHYKRCAEGNAAGSYPVGGTPPCGGVANALCSGYNNGYYCDCYPGFQSTPHSSSTTSLTVLHGRSYCRPLNECTEGFRPPRKLSRLSTTKEASTPSSLGAVGFSYVF